MSVENINPTDCLPPLHHIVSDDTGASTGVLSRDNADKIGAAELPGARWRDFIDMSLVNDSPKLDRMKRSDIKSHPILLEPTPDMKAASGEAQKARSSGDDREADDASENSSVTENMGPEEVSGGQKTLAVNGKVSVIQEA